MVGAYDAILGVDRCALDQWQQVALHALTRYIAARLLLTCGDLVNFVQEDNAVLFGIGHRHAAQVFFVDAFGRFFFSNQLEGFLDRHFACFLLFAAQAGEHATQLFGHFFHAGRGHDFHLRHGLLDFDFDFHVVDLALAQTLAEGLARRIFFTLRFAMCVAWGWDQDVKNAIFGGVFGLGADAAHFLLTGLLDGNFDQVANNGVDIAANIAYFREFGGFNLDEGCVGQLGQAPGNFGFAHAGGADHQDVFGDDFVAQGLGHLLAAPAVSQGHRDRALGLLLANDMLVEFRDDFAGGHVQCSHNGSLREFR